MRFIANQQLINYINQQLLQGISQEVIINSLISKGWQQPDINEAFSLATGQTFSAQVNVNASNIGDATKNKKATRGLVLGIVGLKPRLISYIDTIHNPFQ